MLNSIPRTASSALAVIGGVGVHVPVLRWQIPALTPIVVDVIGDFQVSWNGHGAAPNSPVDVVLLHVDSSGTSTPLLSQTIPKPNNDVSIEASPLLAVSVIGMTINPGDSFLMSLQARVPGISSHWIDLFDSVSIFPNITNPGSSYCEGDGASGVCPFAATGNPGGGCLNSSGTQGARLTGVGNAFFGVDNFGLQVDGVPGNKPGLILRGMGQLNGGLGNPAGDGLLCTGGQTARSQVKIAAAGSGDFTHFAGSPFGASTYGIGVPTNYQFWYRDPSNLCSGAGFNFSNAWAVTWTP